MAHALAPAEPCPTPTEEPESASPERIAALVRELTVALNKSLKQIGDINRQARLLSLNARIEACRAPGPAGAAFGIVAQAMSELSAQTARAATDLGERTRRTVTELEHVNELLGTNTRGTRLSDLALTNIDLIDRNLYERSCDVRWWATDPSAVNALATDDPGSREYAARRLGVILDSYTVYFDLVLCDPRGTVVANGRPGRYASLGTNHAHTAWFRSAWESGSGTEFGFQSVHECPLVDRQRALVYSCAVRAGGAADGKSLGVLGIVFNWDALAQTIVRNLPLSAEERERTRACITDENGFVLADSHGQQLRETLIIPNREALFRQAKGFVLAESGNDKVCYAHARAPGFETYSTGWHSLLIYTY